MSSLIETAVATLDEKAKAAGLDKSVKFTVEGEGSIVVDGSGAREADDSTDLTITTDAETFQAILDGSQDSTAAFMQGKLKIDGDMGLAMSIGNILG
jgi:putative sterol carrier protein